MRNWPRGCRKWAAGDSGPPRHSLSIDETEEAIEFLITRSDAFRSAPLISVWPRNTYGDFWAYKHRKTNPTGTFW